MKHTTISLGLAKIVIQVCHIDRQGEILFNKPMFPEKTEQFLGQAKPCVVAMEGCGSFHHWARLAQKHGHTVKGMSPKHVKPFISKQKTDANDAIGIAIASSQISMPLCQVKTVEQQSLQSLQVSRKWFDKTITSLGNHMRALCYEFGATIAKSKVALRHRILAWLDDEDIALPHAIKRILGVLWEQYTTLSEQKNTLTKQIEVAAADSPQCQQLMKIEGIGSIGAVGLVSSLGDGRGFKNGRHASVYIGATPKQFSSGGKVIMLGINKHGGDKALRSVLYQGAMSVISRLPDVAQTYKQQWLIELVRRVGLKRACVALINKNIRTAWALLFHQTDYQVQAINP
jgi:transposase